MRNNNGQDNTTYGVIDCFDGEFSFLSNFYPCNILIEDITYPSVEHAFQAMKTNNIKDRVIISKLETAGKAKRAGRKVQLVSNWEEIKLDVMYELCKIKFEDIELSYKLKATYPAILIEGNTWNDKFWGMCNGYGQNNLGKILQKIRDEIK